MHSASLIIDVPEQLEISMRWYLATTADHDTHLAAPAPGDNVEALCNKTFRPHFELPGKPLDPLQICAACLAKRDLVTGVPFVAHRKPRMHAARENRITKEKQHV